MDEYIVIPEQGVSPTEIKIGDRIQCENGGPVWIATDIGENENRVFVDFAGNSRQLFNAESFIPAYYRVEHVRGLLEFKIVKK